MTRPNDGADYAPFLSDLRVSELPEGPLLQARFEVTALGDVTLPFTVPAALDRAVPKRRAEFAAGRLLAHLGQQHLNRSPEPIAMSEARAPVWPKGLTGSITHSTGQIAVWLSTRPNLSLGLDLEATLHADALRAVRSRVLSDAEADVIGFDAWRATAAFSAKETLFKALYPRVQRFFGFDAAEILDLSDDQAVLALREDLSPSLAQGKRFAIALQRVPQGALTRLSVSWEAHPMRPKDRI